jgi:hypothetical protein
MNHIGCEYKLNGYICFIDDVLVGKNMLLVVSKLWSNILFKVMYLLIILIIKITIFYKYI